jgi:hypothetical protein
VAIILRQKKNYGNLQISSFHLQRLVVVWGTLSLFANVGYHLLDLVFIFANFEWLFQILNFHLQRLVVVYSTFPSFVKVGYHLLNLVSLLHILNGFYRSFRDLIFIYEG